jgi:hypothetical protein
MIAYARHAELVSASIPSAAPRAEKWTLNQVQGDVFPFAVEAQKRISLEGSVG